ncbi:unnamed protein product [Linum trigynum]|uniref:Uncharacterized protein n=1 Tax=Linum trigynum TaxID=586398 RepID=A0AAV2EQ31_9ROSI
MAAAATATPANSGDQQKFLTTSAKLPVSLTMAELAELPQDQLRERVQQSINYWSPEAMRSIREGKDGTNEVLVEKQPPTMVKDAADKINAEVEETDVDEFE